MSRLRCALGCALLCSVSGVARAEGPPLNVSELVVDPGDARHLALRSTFGLMLSQNGGSTWDFRCKAGIGQGRAEPALAILNGGAVALGTTNGVMVGDASGCDFTRAAGIAENVTDVIAEPRAKGVALAVSASFDDPSSRVWRSGDGARSFAALGERIPHFTALSIGVSAASSDRVYLTGLMWGETVRGALARSDDGGKSFAIVPLEGSDSGKQPFIAAVDPEQPDTVYLRFTGLPGTLRASNDAGHTFHEILSISGPIQGFALSPSGDELFASSLEAGQYRGAKGSLKLDKVAPAGMPCLASTKESLLACGERSRHGFIVGRSLDRGQSFTPILDTPSLTAPTCPASTSVGSMCKDQWAKLSTQLAGMHTASTHVAEAHAVPAQSSATRAASCKCELGSAGDTPDSRLARFVGWGLALCVALRRLAARALGSRSSLR